MFSYNNRIDFYRGGYCKDGGGIRHPGLPKALVSNIIASHAAVEAVELELLIAHLLDGRLVVHQACEIQPDVGRTITVAIDRQLATVVLADAQPRRK